ncbi:MAG: RNA polymerase sigma factor (sigma-70 family) [Salibacteraceae bacterium]|jgi:RNA polymerase sigma factor (sigma-70 family)
MKIDRTLIKKCLKGDEKAYYQLYTLCFSILMSVCVRYYRNKEEASPVLNQAFLRITQNLDKYHSEVPWDRWIKRIMINSIINEYKSHKKNKEVFVPTNFDSNNEQFDNYSVNDIVSQIDVDHIKSFIHQLPNNQKEVFNLYAIDGYTHQEISVLMDIPLGTSKWLLAEARKKLKGMISHSLNINKAIAI